MLHGVKNGWGMIVESFRIFRTYPLFLLPLLLTWCIYAPVILWLNFGIDTDNLTFLEDITYAFGIIFLFAFILTISCSLLLELIQQKESNQKLSFSKALTDTFSHNLFNMIPIVILWTVIWFFLVVLQAIFSKKHKDPDDQKLSAETAARALAGDGSWTLSEAFFKALQKVVRMVVFLILPAIAWENKDFAHAWKRGMSILSAHRSEFVAGFVLTEAVAMIIFLPIGLLFYVAGEMELVLPDFVWLLSIVYIAIAWSYSLYVEQMFTALLFLWHRKWEKEVEIAKGLDMPPPPFSKTEKPSLLDDVFEFPNTEK